MGIAIGLLALGVPALLFVRAGIYDIGEQSAESFVTQLGVKHATAVNGALEQARTALDTFTGNADNTLVVTGYLLRDVRTSSETYIPRISDDAIASLFRRSLLNPAASTFDSVRLIDRNGQILVNITVSSASFEATDASQTAAYQAIKSAQLRGQLGTLAVSGTDTPAVELINTILWRDGEPLGYVAVTLNNGRIFYNNIRTDPASETFAAYTFLTTTRGALIAPPALYDSILPASRSVGVSHGLAGQNNVATYTAADGASYIGYYTPISGTPFVLVTQAPAETVNANSLAFFQTRVFVIGAGMVTLLILLALLFTQLTVPPLSHLRRATLALSNGDFDLEIPEARRGDEIGLLSASFVNMRDQVRALIEDLENRVAARTRDISATQDISRFAATQRDLQTLMDRVVDLIIERFTNIYHAQIFLIDEDRQDAVLRASTGEVGKQLLSHGHRLAIGSLSVIGQVAQQGRLIVARDAAISQIHRRNEFLPETRAELAIPLRVGESIIGALDVQSRIRDAFDEDLSQSAANDGGSDRHRHPERHPLRRIAATLRRN